MQSSDYQAVYFASDLHLGVPNYEKSLEREKFFIRWLEEIRQDAAEIYLLGDIFDFWFEYKTVVPKGYFRLFSKLVEIQESGIPITVFVGNHDLWMRDYFPKYLKIPVLHQPIEKEFFGKKFFLAHGDGLGPGDHGFKIMKWGFKNPVLQWFFGWLHPNIGIGLANFFSRRSRKANYKHDEVDYGDKEFLHQFVKKHSAEHPEMNYYVFGHRHLPKDIKIGEARMINLGDWITHFTYLRVASDSVELKIYTEKS